MKERLTITIHPATRGLLNSMSERIDFSVSAVVQRALNYYFISGQAEREAASLTIRSTS